ncbi:hypothetical protein OIV83_004028 [Microbotryomycetes sp. JL201]|nr:hypothetical protein OIV83_004028 [Microbotryomycetes sp. JL201]
MSVDISSPREPTIRGRRVQTPLEVAQFIEEVIKRHMRSALGPEDTALMERANKKLMVHATTGLAIGSMAGTLFVFRGRWSAAKRVLGIKTSATTGTASGGAGASHSKFYPSLGSAGAQQAEAQGANTVTSNASNRSRLWFMARGLGAGMLGAMIGTQIGVWSGTKSAQRVIAESGRENDIARSLTSAVRAAVAEIEANSTGLEVKNHALLKSAAKYSELAPGGDWGDLTTDDPAALGNASPVAPAPSVSGADKPKSRWDELRQSNATPPSSWDVIRERSARENIPHPSVNRGDHSARFEETNKSDSTTDEDRRKKFDELMEKERRGGDDRFSPDSKSN